ncbi:MULTISPECIES: PAN domain-containing protein [unclassified Rhizobium]|uniref:PAN domain-containing protein n=1 Tax=unclassified Rhizobium TaxID=2613769 RepID=UPI001FCD8558|nr:MULTISPECIES: PAN domain-containing protein [unclassified Rhizobium]
MKIIRVLRLMLAVSLPSLFMASPGLSAEKVFGPFSISETAADVIVLNGEIDIGSALNFRRALQAAPNAKLLTLNSPGGTVQMALLVADDVHERGISTYIAKESGCHSACALVFLAGVERQADGALGVHQISSESGDLVSAQLSISDILDVLNRFGTPVEVMTWMFKTPPNDMHIFTADEIASYKINRKRQEPAPTASQAATSIESTPTATTITVTPTVTPTTTATTDQKPVVGDQALANLSAIEDYTRRPTRMALYTGLDLFGDDLRAERMVDAAQCAKTCLAMNGVCKAFTFNTNSKIIKGPNCFLKSSEGRADGNAVAISGKFLSSVEPDPQDFTISTIDPTASLFKDVDLPGGDLSSRPAQIGGNAQQCRLTCIDDGRCVAFTYIKRKKECWLKGAIGAPRFGAGMVTGVKDVKSFAATKIISLQ